MRQLGAGAQRVDSVWPGNNGQTIPTPRSSVTSLGWIFRAAYPVECFQPGDNPHPPRLQPPYQCGFSHPCLADTAPGAVLSLKPSDLALFLLKLACGPQPLTTGRPLVHREATYGAMI